MLQPGLHAAILLGAVPADPSEADATSVHVDDETAVRRQRRGDLHVLHSQAFRYAGSRSRDEPAYDRLRRSGDSFS
jgi:hypothetical protein